MKKIYSYLRKATNDRLRGALLLLGGLLLFGAQSAWAATAHDFDGTEKMFIKNMYPAADSGQEWAEPFKSSSVDVYAYFFGGSSSAIFTAPATLYAGVANTANAIYVVTIPAGNYSKVLLTRETAGRSEEERVWSGDNFKGQTFDIELNADINYNYLTYYRASGSGDYYHWAKYLYTLVGINEDWGVENNPFNEEYWCKVSISSGDNMSFKVYSGDTWYGWTENVTANISTTNTSTVISNTNGAGNAWLERTVSGDYVFGWDPATTTISVSFPGTYSRSLTNAWGTICLPYAVTSANRATSNAKYYSISHIADSKLYLQEETGDLSAGQPYIFEYQGAVPGTLTITCGTAASAISNNRGLIGTYAQGTIASGENYYIVQGGVVKAVNAGAVNIAANRAYIDKDEVDQLTPSLAPTLRELPFAPQSPTDIQSIEANEKAIKFFENGKLFIRKNGVVYDMTGRVVR